MAATWVPIGERAMMSVQAPTETAPVPGDLGLSLLGVSSFAVTFVCDSGQSFASSAGQWDLFYFDENVGDWSIVANMSQPVPPEAAGRRRVSLSFQIQNARGRLALINNGLVLTSGSLTHYYSPATAWHPTRAL